MYNNRYMGLRVGIDVDSIMAKTIVMEVKHRKVRFFSILLI
jgi:hypothetical protein